MPMPRRRPERVRLAGGPRKDGSDSVFRLLWWCLACAFLGAVPVRAGILDLAAFSGGAEVPTEAVLVHLDPPRDPASWNALDADEFRPLGRWAGFRPGAVLLRVHVVAPRSGLWWIRQSYANVDSMRVETEGQASCWIGEDVPRRAWCAPWHGLWLPVPLREGPNTVHLMLVERTGRLGVSLRLEPDGVRQAAAEDAALRDGILAGLLLANLLLASFLFAIVRHRGHLWYLVYQGFVIVFVLGSHQHAFAWLWPSLTAPNQVVPSFGSLGAFGALALFLTHLLGFSTRFPRSGPVLRLLGSILVGLALLQLAIPVWPWVVDLLYSGPQAEILEASSWLLGIVLLVRSSMKGHRDALLALVATAPMVVALAVGLGGELLHESWMYSHRGVIVESALCLENLLLSLFLARKVYMERRDHQRLLEKHLALEKGFNERLVNETDQHLRGTALDLHDGIGQDLVALRLQADMLRHTVLSGSLCDRLDAELARVAESIRATAHGLYPPELQGGALCTALQLLGDRLRVHETLELQVEGRMDDLTEAQALQWYRIAQEAIQNALKHGHAKVVRLHLERDRMRIEDDGPGFPEATEDGVGLRTIRARASQLGCQVRIGRAENGGACVEVAPFFL